MLAITLDVDWAPDKIVDEVILVLDSYHVPATLFCTNFLKDLSGNSSSLAGRLHERHEIALHPNFQNTGAYDEVWDAILELYPYAKGWRSHNGVTGWPITSGGAQRGLRYEVYPSVFHNYVVPCQVNRVLRGHYVFTTAFWDSHMLHEPGFSWSTSDLPHRKLFEDDSKLVVLGFHPNILYYDMRSHTEYDARKSSYHEVDVTASFRHHRPDGAMKLLYEILEMLPSQHFTTISSYGTYAGFW